MITLSIKDNCIRCGRCVAVCPVRILTQEEKNGEIGIVNLPTCIQCGQCVSICPTDSVEHSLFPQETIHTIDNKLIPSADNMMEIMRRRRSNRAFNNKEVPGEYLEQILEAANLAPTAKNAQPLKYTLVTNPDVLKSVHQATMEVCSKLYEQLKNSDDPKEKAMAAYCLGLRRKYDSGYEIILRYAKALIMIHSDNPAAVLDANLAYQNASLMAEALGVAHFYTGYVRVFASADVEGIIHKTMQIEEPILAGMALGMPRYTFDKYVDRREQIVNRLL